ncbi:MAG: AmmeMemoRadiSam system protein B [Pseudomonadota bacterium]
MIRNNILAGSWYPGTAREMNDELKEYIKVDEEPGPAIGVVVPHAGWRYSGGVAGKVFASVRVPDTVVVISPNHRGAGNSKAIWDKGAWKIPGATIPVEEELAALLVEHAGLVSDTFAHQHEHSLEILLPFLFFRNPGVKIAPVCLEPLPPSDLQQIGEGIARAIKEAGGDILIVASSDMSHFISVAEAKKLDGMAIEKMESLDPEGLQRTVRENDITMCGVIPAAVMLYAALELGAKESKLIAYATSADVTGDTAEVVAYAGIVVK